MTTTNSTTYVPYTQTTGTSTTSSYITTPNYVTTNTYSVWNEIPKLKIDSNGVFVDGKRVLTEDDLKKEEKKPMDKFNFNFDFGPVDRSNIAVCPNGIAVKNVTTNSFCYYDPDKHEVVDTPFTFGAKKFLYKLPVAVSAIVPGDVIMHNGNPMFVKGYEDEEGRIVVIDIASAEEKYILPIKNMFGFNYVTKIVSLLDAEHCGASEDLPFGNMLPFLMMEGEKDIDPFVMMMMMGGLNKGEGTNPFSNQMLPFLMMMKKS